VISALIWGAVFFVFGSLIFEFAPFYSIYCIFKYLRGLGSPYFIRAPEPKGEWEYMKGEWEYI